MSILSRALLLLVPLLSVLHAKNIQAAKTFDKLYQNRLFVGNYLLVLHYARSSEQLLPLSEQKLYHHTKSMQYKTETKWIQNKIRTFEQQVRDSMINDVSLRTSRYSKMYQCPSSPTRIWMDLKQEIAKFPHNDNKYDDEEDEEDEESVSEKKKRNKINKRRDEICEICIVHFTFRDFVDLIVDTNKLAFHLIADKCFVFGH